MKKFLSALFIMALVTSLSFANGAQEKADDAGISIGVAIQGNQSTFMQYVVAGMHQRLDEAENVEMHLVYAEDRADKQVSQIETFVAQGVDVIVLNPVDKVGSSAAVEIANEAGIPIVTVNTQTENQADATAFSGSDDVEAGRLQMEALAKALDYRGNVALIHGAMGHDAQLNRDFGFKEVIAKYPDMKIIYEQSADWSTAKAQSIMENWLQMEEEINGVATTCDILSLGAQNAIDAQDLTGRILVTGNDCIPDAMTSIEEGKMVATLYQDGIGQGNAAIELAIAIANGNSVEDIYIPYEVVSMENLDKFKDVAAERDSLVEKYF